MYLLGLDIGGTKCAAVTATWDGEKITLLQKEKCPTDLTVSPETMLDRLFDMAERILVGRPDAIGISCGGPLDSARGVVMGPPNLPGWDNVPVADLAYARFGVKATLQNDANACAVAEWKFGAGRGTKNMVFLTFGTGLGAGLILDGRLYEGKSGNAGEVGHIRLAEDGPVGYGKRGSFEGFCSGGGIAQIGLRLAEERAGEGGAAAYYEEGDPASVTAKSIADAAEKGDETAKEVYRLSGEYLGKGLAVLIDILDPECIVIGSIFQRSRALLWDAAKKEIDREALPLAARGCTVVGAALGEHIGDYAAVAIALIQLEGEKI